MSQFKCVICLFMFFLIFWQPVVYCDSNELIKALESNSASEVRNLINNSRFDINSFYNDSKGNSRTPLMIASENGFDVIVSILIKNGANINLTSNDKVSALLLSSKEGHYAVTKLLVNSGCNLGLRSKTGFTPMMAAAVNGHTGVVSIILEKCKENRPNISAQCNDTREALIAAASNGQRTIVDIILKSDPSLSGSKEEIYRILEQAEDSLKSISGRILEKSESGITIDGFGQTQIFPLNERTRILNQDCKETSLSTLNTGDFVEIRMRKNQVVDVSQKIWSLKSCE